MKKTALFLTTIALVSACSTSDDSTTIDPISSQPYIPLANFNELTPGEYQYVGNDIGNGIVGLVNPASENCKEKDFLVVYKDTAQKVDSIAYYNFKTTINSSKEKVCSLLDDNFHRVLRNIKLDAVGVAALSMTVDYTTQLTEQESKTNQGKESTIKRRTLFSGTVDIGHQAGYLRIEDNLSGYKPGSKIKGKPYLYFKKK